jgi:PiT family inorganic phosphate transporter
MGTLATLAGSMGAMPLSGRLVKLFTGSGLVSDALVHSQAFVVSVALGAAGTVVLATVLSFPISTTHSLMGGLLGAGLMMDGHVHVAALTSRFLLPLLASPLIAIAITATSQWSVARLYADGGRQPQKPNARTASPMLGRLHFLSSGAVSFARGL